MRPLRVFFPQIVGATLSTVSWMLFIPIPGIWCIPFGVFGGICGLVTIIRTCKKVDYINCEDDWNNLDWKRYQVLNSKCWRCNDLQGQLNAMTKDRDETRNALVALKID